MLIAAHGNALGAASLWQISNTLLDFTVTNRHKRLFRIGFFSKVNM